MKLNHNILIMITCLAAFVMLSGCTKLYKETPCPKLDKEEYLSCMSQLETSQYEFSDYLYDSFYLDKSFTNTKQMFTLCESVRKDLSGDATCQEKKDFDGQISLYFNAFRNRVKDTLTSLDIGTVSDDSKAWFNEEKKKIIDASEQCGDFECIYNVLTESSKLSDLVAGDLTQLYALGDEEFNTHILSLVEEKTNSTQADLDKKEKELSRIVEKTPIEGFKSIETLDDFKKVRGEVITQLSEEKKKSSNLFSSRIIFLTIVFTLLLIVAQIIYYKKYQEQVEFWRTYTSSTTFLEPKTVVAAMFVASIVSIVLGLFLLYGV